MTMTLKRKENVYARNIMNADRNLRKGNKENGKSQEAQILTKSQSSCTGHIKNICYANEQSI